ncbi:hypothetical protein D3C87_1530780 [compost metagenome]
MLLVRRLKKKPSSAPKKKRVASLLLRRPLPATPLRRRLQLPNLFAKARRWLPLLQLRLLKFATSRTNSAVRTNHVLTTTIVAAVVVMASAKTLRIAHRSKKKRRLHVWRHALPTKKAMASVAVVAARPS